MSNVIDVSPLPRKVNPFKFCALQMRNQARAAQSAGQLTPEQVTTLSEQIEWLELLGQRIKYDTDRPMTCFLLSGMALSAQDRADVARVIKEIDQVILAESGQVEQPKTARGGGYELPE